MCEQGLTGRGMARQLRLIISSDGKCLGPGALLISQILIFKDAGRALHVRDAWDMFRLKRRELFVMYSNLTPK